MIYACCDENRKAAVWAIPCSTGSIIWKCWTTRRPAGQPRQQTLLVHCLNRLESLAEESHGAECPHRRRREHHRLHSRLGSRPRSFAAATCDRRRGYLFRHAARRHESSRHPHQCRRRFFPLPLRLVNDATQAAQDPFEVTEALSGFDPQLAEVKFSFKVECGPDFDCAPAPMPCAPQLPPPPPINYLAKDYGSFRTVILDRLNQLLPSWQATSEADIGIVLAELIAYVGDQLSYQQDAVATEAYLLDGAQPHLAAPPRAARRLHRARRLQCRAWVHAAQGLDASCSSTARKRVSTPTRRGCRRTLTGNEQAALAAGVSRLRADAGRGTSIPNTTRCSSTPGATPTAACRRVRPKRRCSETIPICSPAMCSIFQEVMGPQTGFAGDADIRHRCAVRLTAVATTDAFGNPLVDPLFEAGTGATIISASQPPTPVTEIQWSAEDALPFALCVSSKFLTADGIEKQITGVSVAYGNVVLADQGLTMPAFALDPVPAPTLFQPPSTINRCNPAQAAAFPVFYRPQLPTGPLTQAVALPLVGAPVTPNPVPLSAKGYVSLEDGTGLVALMAKPKQLSQWPQYFGVKAAPNPANNGNFDLTVVYQPQASSGVVLEAFANLTLTPGAPNNAATQINAQSRLLVAPPTQPAPPSGGGNPTSFPASPTPLSSSGAITLSDGAGNSYLSVVPASLASWPPQFALLAQGNLALPTRFNLQLYYLPPTGGGIGVTLPVLVEAFDNLSLATIDAGVASNLVSLLSFELGPNPNLSADALMSYDAHQAAPAITLSAGGVTWTPAPDLLAAGPTDPNFVVEVESDSVAHLRFGDSTNNINGATPAAGTVFTASCRIGNGTAGNVGADSLTRFQPYPGVVSCTNPLPATGGIDPETTEQIRRRAPQAFVTQERAVTVSDYATVTQEASSQIEDAAAELRWTGSWHTAFIAAEPKSGGDLSPALRRSLYQFVNRFRLAGQDIKIESPQLHPARNYAEHLRRSELFPAGR